MLNHVEYPSSVKEGTETPGAFDQNGQRFYVLDRLQEQASRIRYLLDTAVFFRNQLETCQAAGNAEAAQSAYLSLSSGRIGIANGVRSLKPLLLELEHPAASICEALVDQISSFELMTRDYSKFSGGISRFLDTLPSYHTVDASTIGRLMNHVKLGHYPTDLTHVGYLERGIAFPDKTVNLLDPCCELGTRCCAWPSDMTAGATASSWMRKGPDWPSKSCSGLPMVTFSAPMWETDHFMQYSLTRHISQSHLAAG